MHENIGATVVRSDESEALFGVEPLNGAFRQNYFSSLGASPKRQVGAPGLHCGPYHASAETIRRKLERPLSTDFSNTCGDKLPENCDGNLFNLPDAGAPGKHPRARPFRIVRRIEGRAPRRGSKQYADSTQQLG
ncbi:hypothetical protein GCM10014719_18740 [Planomonospora parontospora subsp. antibiotica]|nr:hypothetical protein GCM10014719_18740 [Planomonospora parontospora subsp. antibiotica]GII15315.1 hypothetical protein Ppa05_20410 [Planomonospora parontospora subsp. antibiotica]